VIPNREEGPSPTEVLAAKTLVDERLAAQFGSTGDLVSHAAHVALTSPGKRLRPLMVILGAADLGADFDAAVDVGCALELVHAASLVLDDLPCMDDADTRRGAPAVHRAFGEDVAVLASIALIARAFKTLTTLRGVTPEARARLATILADAMGVDGLVGGQLDDLRGDRADETGACSVMERKTAALFVAALEMACVLAEGDGACRQALLRIGREIGLAFQILDDLLDLEGAAVGKPVGQDDGKPNLVRLIGAQAGRARYVRHVESALVGLASLPGGAPRLSGLLQRAFADALAPAGAGTTARVAAAAAAP
jgi:geranylgeranyl diphosphate synthase type II